MADRDRHAIAHGRKELRTEPALPCARRAHHDGECGPALSHRAIEDVQQLPQLSVTARLEFFDDVEGNRTGFKGLYTALTGGLNFKPRPGIVFRPELRYDYNDETRPFEGKHGVGTATADLIFRW